MHNIQTKLILGIENSNFVMTKKNQISLEEAKVPDLKKNISLSGIHVSDFPIIGIGVSAGGLEALELFFNNMPNNSGMAFVVIQHLDPTHAGIMPELLQRMTQMKVLQATDVLRVKPNSVYVIPPNKSLSILNGRLHLFDPIESRSLRLPIDLFFRSLALDRMQESVGIILSGMGSDGSMLPPKNQTKNSHNLKSRINTAASLKLLKMVF